MDFCPHQRPGDGHDVLRSNCAKRDGLELHSREEIELLSKDYAHTAPVIEPGLKQRLRRNVVPVERGEPTGPGKILFPTFPPFSPVENVCRYSASTDSGVQCASLDVPMDLGMESATPVSSLFRNCFSKVTSSVSSFSLVSDERVDERKVSLGGDRDDRSGTDPFFSKGGGALDNEAKKERERKRKEREKITVKKARKRKRKEKEKINKKAREKVIVKKERKIITKKKRKIKICEQVVAKYLEMI